MRNKNQPKIKHYSSFKFKKNAFFPPFFKLIIRRVPFEQHTKKGVFGTVRTESYRRHIQSVLAFISIRHTTAVPLLLGGIVYYPPGTSTGFYFPSRLLSSPFCFSLPPSRNSDPGSRSSLFPPSPLRFEHCIYNSGRFQLFILPSSTRVELFLPTLGALRS